MAQSDPHTDVLADIVETLEACGLDRDEYRLYDSIEVEALERLLASSGDVEVQFTVEAIRLRVTPERVEILSDDVPDPSRG